MDNEYAKIGATTPLNNNPNSTQHAQHHKVQRQRTCALSTKLNIRSTHYKTKRFVSHAPKHDIHDPMDTNAHHHLETNNTRQHEPVDRKKKHRPIIPQHTAVNAQHRAMPLLESLTPTEKHLDVSLVNAPRKDPTSKHTHRVPLTKWK